MKTVTITLVNLPAYAQTADVWKFAYGPASGWEANYDLWDFSGAFKPITESITNQVRDDDTYLAVFAWEIVTPSPADPDGYKQVFWHTGKLAVMYENGASYIYDATNNTLAKIPPLAFRNLAVIYSKV